VYITVFKNKNGKNAIVLWKWKQDSLKIVDLIQKNNKLVYNIQCRFTQQTCNNRSTHLPKLGYHHGDYKHGCYIQRLFARSIYSGL
jgi:hypothetical protein